MTKDIINKIKEYNKIIIMRHQRPDGDCIGASLGLKDILRVSFKNKEIKVLADDFAESLNFIDYEDNNIHFTNDIYDEEYYKDALCIVVDTANTARISNKMFDRVKEVIKIDHHPNADPYGTINWVEEERSSVCEMIAYLVMKNPDQLILTDKAAQLLFMGMVTDSGRFRFSSTSPETLKCASFLLEKNINLEMLYANLYLKDFSSFKLQSEVYKKMKITKNGVAYIYIPKSMQEKFGLTPNEASLMVSSLDSIKGSLIWLAFIDNTDESIRVRLRSRFLDINDIAVNYNGGGHGRASGATVYSLKEMKNLINDCDKKLKKFKEENKGWL